jgi:ATPase family associated with various cellular activities (AAA)
MSMERIDMLIGDAVRSVAGGEADPTDPYRGLYITDACAVSTAAALDGGGLDARLQHAAALLELDQLDATLLGLCAAPVLDARYGRLIGYLHDDLTRKLPSPRLLARLLDSDAGERPVLARLAAAAPLRRGGAIAMLEEPETTPSVDRLLALDEQLAAILLGAELAPDTLAGELREISPAAGPGRDGPTARRVLRVLAAADGLAVLCAGADAEQVLAQALGCGLVVIDAARLADERLCARARLRATLTGARLAVDGLERLAPAERAGLGPRLASLSDAPLLLASGSRVPPALSGLAHLTVIVPSPEESERARLWAAHVPERDAADVAAAFRLSSQQIGHAARLANAEARSADRRRASREDLLRAARRVARRDLDEQARLLRAPYAWADLVLADEELAQLQSIAAYLRHRSLVLETWGFGRRVAPEAGLKVLFAGESGTGKTMAGQVIANALGLDLYRVDLARTVSKFIGETEKSLARLFDAAEDASAVIFFDEADALFGKRSAVSDAHDRYANLEVAYLLQRIEEFTGAVILATNLRHNLDQAFLRRLDFVVEFSLPDRARRRLLWERHLPDEAPLAGDVDLDALADHSLPGGSIRNCVLHAAFGAAQDGGEISRAHLERALRLEQRKLGRLAIAAEQVAE